MRTLASIQKIADLKPIPNADAIEVATVLGWNVVVKKNEFKVGDLCVYIEIDSVLPPRPEFEFLSPKYRIKTVRLRGQVSQGICFPLSILFGTSMQNEDKIEEGVDVTEILGVVKYEPPIPSEMAGKMRGPFPGFIPKTDETRIQSYPDILTKYQSIPFYVTEKLDGSSVTMFIKDDEFHVCSRNTDLFDTPDNTIWQVAKEMDIEKKLRDMGGKYALQGEIVGGKIQGNKLKLPKAVIYFFNLYDMEKGEYVSFDTFSLMAMQFNFPRVPLIDAYFYLKGSVDAMVEWSTRKSVINPDAWAEGFVFRPRTEMRDPDLGRLSFKVINPEFLLKNEE